MKNGQFALAIEEGTFKAFEQAAMAFLVSDGKNARIGRASTKGDILIAFGCHNKLKPRKSHWPVVIG